MDRTHSETGLSRSGLTSRRCEEAYLESQGGLGNVRSDVRVHGSLVMADLQSPGCPAALGKSAGCEICQALFQAAGHLRGGHVRPLRRPDKAGLVAGRALGDALDRDAHLAGLIGQVFGYP